MRSFWKLQKHSFKLTKTSLWRQRVPREKAADQSKVQQYSKLPQYYSRFQQCQNKKELSSCKAEVPGQTVGKGRVGKMAAEARAAGHFDKVIIDQVIHLLHKEEAAGVDHSDRGQNGEKKI